MTRRVVLGAAALAAAALATTGLVAALSGRPLAYLTREPGAAVWIDGCSGHDCAYAGLLSLFGYLAWASGATFCFLGAALTPAPPGGRRASPLLWGGLVTLMLLADDMLMVHDDGLYGLAPGNDWAVVLAYAVVAGAVAWCFRAFLRTQPAWLLGISVGLFAVSIAADKFLPGRHALEDGAKFVGIVAWAAFFALAAVPALHAAPEAGRPGEPRLPARPPP